MIWKVEFDDRAAKELRKLDKGAQEQILAYLRERIGTADDPRRFGKSLSGNFAGLWRYRIQNYRLICVFEHDRLAVLVLRVGHRKNVYENDL